MDERMGVLEAAHRFSHAATRPAGAGDM